MPVRLAVYLTPCQAACSVPHPDGASPAPTGRSAFDVHSYDRSARAHTAPPRRRLRRRAAARVGAVVLAAACGDGSTAPPGGTPGGLPAGPYFVYSAFGDAGGSDIVVVRPDGTDRRVLAPAPGLEYAPDWSPDGARIAFVSDRDRPGGDIYVMDADGRNVRRVTRPGDPNDANQYPRWSPDGRRLAYMGRRAGNDDVYTVNADGSDERRLTTGPGFEGQPSWSPDGRTLAFTSVRDHGPCPTGAGPGTVRTLYLMDADGANVRHAVPGLCDIVFASAWSPDGGRIAFTAHNAAETADDLWVLNVATGARVRVTNDVTRRDRFLAPIAPDGVAWHPAGDRLLFTRMGSGGRAASVTTVRLTDAAEERLAVPDAQPYTPALRPTATR